MMDLEAGKRGCVHCEPLGIFLPSCTVNEVLTGFLTVLLHLIVVLAFSMGMVFSAIGPCDRMEWEDSGCFLGLDTEFLV